MRVGPSCVIESPLNSGWKRLAAEVTYESKDHPSETIWFDFEPAASDGIAATGNPWAALLTPLAMTLGEDLYVADPIDPLLLENIHELIDVWKSWNETLHRIQVHAPLDTSSDLLPSNRVAAFFSGGLDSFFTALRNEHATRLKPAIDDLVTVWGFDIPVDRRDDYAIARTSLTDAAGKLGKRHLTVATNLRETLLDRLCSWEKLMHGPAMTAIAVAMDRQYGRFLIPSSYAYIDNMPYGSHPVTDALFSTRRMRVLHDGCGYKRIPKAELVATSPIAHTHLRVCWEGGRADNCCRCTKCLRTMVVFEALDALNKFTVFDKDAFSPEILRGWHVRRESEFKPLELLVPYIKARNKSELLEALTTCLARSRKLNQRIEFARRFINLPLLGGLARRVIWRLENQGQLYAHTATKHSEHPKARKA